MVGDFQGCTLHFALCIWLAIAVSLHLVLWLSVKKVSVEPGIPASVRPKKEKPFKLHGGWVIFPKDRVIVYRRNLFFFFFVIRNKLVFIWGDHWCKLITWNNVVGDVKNVFFLAQCFLLPWLKRRQSTLNCVCGSVKKDSFAITKQITFHCVLVPIWQPYQMISPSCCSLM